ncbi:uncharacterized protein LOC127870737 [Dreissena polymorpha]|uniref:Protein stoned-B n=1 Tax=Dreissena polymorpha TaxID=45954 RepID=A0A9D4L9H8_DREPO|nr:uncharacterized protein LOC127870737 [Dreissena polymorpha]KAH3854318.1 hypothetical protein DPMN_096855 [Dreissena polymorpha]
MMSMLALDDSSDLVNTEAVAATNGEEKEIVSPGTNEKQVNLLSFDSPDESDPKDNKESKTKSKKSRARSLFKRAKSPIAGAINKTTKEFKKLSNLPKHHITASQKSPIKSPSKEKLTEEYSKLEEKLNEKTSEEWLQFQQMQERIQVSLHKTKTSLDKYSSQSEDDEAHHSKALSNRWTGFEDASGFEPEVIDTSLNPIVSISEPVDSELLDTCETFDSKEESTLIDTSDTLIDTSVSPKDTTSFLDTFSRHIKRGSKSNMENLLDDFLSADSETRVKQSPRNSPVKIGGSSVLIKKRDNDDFQGLMDSTEPVDALQDLSLQEHKEEGFDSFIDTNTNNTGDRSDSISPDIGSVLSGYTFTSSTSGDAAFNLESQGINKTVDSGILLFEQPLENIVTKINNVPHPAFDTDKDDTCNSISHIEDETLFTFDVDSSSSSLPMAGNSGQSCFSAVAKPLEPLVSYPAKQEQKVTTNSLDQFDFGCQADAAKSMSTVFDDFSSFDPIKSASYTSSLPVQSNSSPINVNVGSHLLRNSSQAPSISFGSLPSSGIEHDIFSKIKRMSSGSQPVSPLRRKVQEKPKDHFGFVKKELKVDEDDDGYKPLADLSKDKQTVSTRTGENSNIDHTASNSSSTVNNPFLSGSFHEDGQIYKSANAAELFGLESNNTYLNNDFDFFIEKQGTKSDGSDSKSQTWVDPSSVDNIDFGGVIDDSESHWDGDTVTSEKMPLGDAWSGDNGSKLFLGNDQDTVTPDNPFQDDFSKLANVTVLVATTEASNPFMSAGPANSSSANPFLDIFGDIDASHSKLNLLDSGMQVNTNFESDNFIGDSAVHQKGESKDTFDPFNFASTSNGINDTESSMGAAAEMDTFSSVAALGDKQLAMPLEDDDHSFMLDIKPISIARPKAESLPIAPAIAPPPKAPKSPIPPRENPFDRDSPPEENFAQFEIKGKVKDKEAEADKKEEPIADRQTEETLPKSLSVDSETTTEEEVVVNLEPLEPFLPECDKDSFKLMLRYPTKKKITGNRYWKNVCVKFEKQKEGIMVRVLNDARDPLPIQELLLQPCYSLSECVLQQYDQYGKIHTAKLQYVFYKERVGIKTERITPSLVKFKKRSEKPKATMILDHSPQVSELLKFGSLDREEIMQFIHKLEDIFMNLEAHREKTLTYTKDEVTAEVHDEYYAELDAQGHVLSQKARCRVFVLAFLTGMPIVEVGLNDRRRKGKEVVGRYDIVPIKTEEWIRLENVEFHCSVNKEEFEKTNNIKFRPLDACQFELMRYRVRLRENKELPLQLTIQQIMKNRKCEVRCDLLVTGYHSYSKKHGQFPCEDIEVRFPIPEQWIYMFRYERRFGYGSVHSAARKPGKIKGLERLTLMAQGSTNQALMEADVGTAKYEHVYRAIVWRIPRLPIRNQGAYTSHLFRLKVELGPHDDIPQSYETHTHVSFTMPCSTVSQSQIRSIATTNPNPPEKWVRSFARYEYRLEIEHLEEYPELMAIGTVYKEAARLSIQPEPEEEERDPRLAQSDTDSSDSD